MSVVHGVITNMKKLTKTLRPLMLLISLSTPSLTAEVENLYATKYRCDNVAGVSEWTIEIDLSGKPKAEFFDNDTWAPAKLVSMRSIETYPSQRVYVFESIDRSKQGRYSLTFNQTQKTASISFMMNERLRTFKPKCMAVDQLFAI